MQKILVLALCTLNMCASELVVKGFSSHKLGDISLIRTDKGYDILKDQIRTEVKPYDVDPLLKRLDKSKLEVFLKEGHGYPEITQLSNGDYKLKARVRGNGGGKITGICAYWATKTICYGVMVAGVTVGLIKFGGRVAGPTGEMVMGGATTAITASAAPEAAVVAGALQANPETAKVAEEAAGAAIAGTAGAIGYYVEYIAQGAQAIGTALPTP